MRNKKNASKVVKTRKVHFEGLEDRRLMAGDVTVRLVNGEAVVTGDGASNAVWIREISANTYRVEGQFRAGAATKVNGKAYADIYTRQDDLRVDMGGGNDSLLIGNRPGGAIMTVEDLTIKMGNGADYLELGNLRVYDRVDPVNITMGDENSLDGNDEIEMNNVAFAASVNILMGKGVDECEMRNVSIRDDLSIDTGSEADEVELVSVSADEFFIKLGSGDDALELEKVKARRMIADGGVGRDRLELRSGNQFTSRSLTSFN